MMVQMMGNERQRPRDTDGGRSGKFRMRSLPCDTTILVLVCRCACSIVQAVQDKKGPPQTECLGIKSSIADLKQLHDSQDSPNFNLITSTHAEKSPKCHLSVSASWP